MLEFHKPTMEDKKWIDDVLASSRHKGDIYTFAQLLLWSPHYGTAICRHEDALLITSGHSGEYCIYPAGSYDIRKVMELMKQHFDSRGLPLVIVAAEEWQRDELMEAFPDRFVAEESRDDFDYIYNAEDLINLFQYFPIGYGLCLIGFHKCGTVLFFFGRYLPTSLL